MKAELHPCSPNWMVEGWSPAHATAIAATILRLWVGNGVCTGDESHPKLCSRALWMSGLDVDGWQGSGLEVKAFAACMDALQWLRYACLGHNVFSAEIVVPLGQVYWNHSLGTI